MPQRSGGKLAYQEKWQEALLRVFVRITQLQSHLMGQQVMEAQRFLDSLLHMQQPSGAQKRYKLIIAPI